MARATSSICEEQNKSRQKFSNKLNGLFCLTLRAVLAAILMLAATHLIHGVGSVLGNAAMSATNGKGAASGVGDLYWWDQSLNGGLGDWVLAQSGVSFTINFYGSGKTGKASTDAFGINIHYSPVSPPGASSLPASAPIQLKGGDIKVQ